MYVVRKVKENELEVILSIYNSLIGTSGCTWSLDYPNIDDVKGDFLNDSLYVIMDNDQIIGAAAAGYSDEFEHLLCWDKDIKKACDLSRVGVRSDFQGKGVAQFLLSFLENDVVKREFDGMHFIVSKTNPKALSLYNKMGYKCVGDVYMYDNDWYCYEKKLGGD